MKFGLTNIRTLCAALGQPHTKYPGILIAGTNGKGSVTAMVDCALRAAGLHVGRYTSPHLVRLEERFVINGEPVTTDALVETIETMRTVIDRLMAAGSLDAPPTFFEVTTAIAFELFRKSSIDLAVLEVGLGGRLDSTNRLRRRSPRSTSITSSTWAPRSLPSPQKRPALFAVAFPLWLVRLPLKRVTSSCRCAQRRAPSSSTRSRAR